MEKWYADAMNMEDDDLVEIPAESVHRACARFNISPPSSGEPLRLPVRLLKQARKAFVGDSPQGDE